MKDLARLLAHANGVAALGCYVVLAIALIAILGLPIAVPVLLAIFAGDMVLTGYRARRLTNS